jgi:hypothetical protein
VRFNPAALRPYCTGGIVLAVLLFTGLATRLIEAPAWQTVRAKQPALRLDSLQDALGQGLSVGLLGGFRAIVADFFWIHTYSRWEDKDLLGTQTSIKLVTAIDPRPIYFWLNGSRVIAYDMPNWRIEGAGSHATVPETVKRRFDVEQSGIAIRYLQHALEHHPDNALLILEIGNIHLNRLNDPATSATFYLRATQLSDAPYYAARIYAQLLRKINQPQEAYAFLLQLYPSLSADDPMAQKSVVLARIRELEVELQIPEGKRLVD